MMDASFAAKIMYEGRRLTLNEKAAERTSANGIVPVCSKRYDTVIKAEIQEIQVGA